MKVHAIGIFVTVSGCLLASAAVPAVEQQKLVKLLPGPLPRGTSAQGAPAFYDSSNLYEYLDGGADVYELYEMAALLHAEFRAGGVDLTADVFDMGSAEAAFGMYASERSPKYEFIAMGAEGYRNEGLLNFFQDCYYVKLSAFGEGSAPVLDDFAKRIAGRIGHGRAFPPMLARLPAAGREPHSEKFIRKDPMGHAFLGPAYQAVYQRGGRESTLMVSVGADAADARSRMKALADHFRSGGQVQPAPEFGEGALRAGNSYEGTLIARVAGRYLVLLLNPGPDAASFFQDAAGRLL